MVPSLFSNYNLLSRTAQKIKFLIKDLFSKCDQIHSLLRIWSSLLKKSLMENSMSCAVYTLSLKLGQQSVPQLFVNLYQSSIEAVNQNVL